MKSPLRYIGGKGGIMDWISSHWPQHNVYISCFGGGGSDVLYGPRTNRTIIYNDIDNELHHFWQVMRDQQPQLIELLVNTPVSRHLIDNLAKERSDDTQYREPLYIAWRYFTLNRQTMNGLGTGNKQNPPWSMSTRLRNGVAEPISSFQSAIEELTEVTKALKPVVLEHLDFRALIKKYDGTEVFYYVDPPYDLGDKPNTYYTKPFTKQDHTDLSKYLHASVAKVMISGYKTPLYEELYKDWRQETLTVTKHSGTTDTKQQAEEVIWMNYEKDKDIFDM